MKVDVTPGARLATNLRIIRLCVKRLVARLLA